MQGDRTDGELPGLSATSTSRQSTPKSPHHPHNSPHHPPNSPQHPHNTHHTLPPPHHTHRTFSFDVDNTDKQEAATGK